MAETQFAKFQRVNATQITEAEAICSAVVLNPNQTEAARKAAMFG